MSRHTEDEIRRLGSRLERQSARVLRQVEAATKALTEQVDIAQVDQLEEEIDREEVLLEEDCLRIMALHHPVGSDLRFLATLLRANGDLERAADHAFNVFALVSGSSGPVPDAVSLLSRRSALLIGQAVRALLERDPHQAAGVLESNAQLHSLAEAAFRQSRTLASSFDPPSLDRAFLMVRLAMDFRRIGELACNLAEDALYLERGDIVRHGGVSGASVG